jgi:hypothetical protein
MTRCDLQGTGAIELYFYDELEPGERGSIEDHLRRCGECARALEELRVIRDALATRPDVSAPASGDWSAFMARLDGAIAADGRAHAGLHSGARRGGYVAYLAIAAVLALVTVGVTVAVRSRHVLAPQTTVSATDDTVRLKPDTTDTQAQDFAALSEEHFERSKLVVLGLTTKDPADQQMSDWAYERDLASSLLNDTRMYRLAAEDRGLTNIAGVMRDLEMVLLQTSMTDEKDPSALRQIQRLIQRRDLLEKMDAVAAPMAGRTMGTKGI